MIAIYRSRAKRYDRTTLLLYLVGFRHRAYRREAVQALHLRLGETVVDLGCGTGLNLSLLQEQIGTRGRLIGVDLTDAMLAEAAARVAQHGRSNVELVRSDAALYVFPTAIDGIISAFALTLVPDFDQVIFRGAEGLRVGGRFVVLDFKMPSNWLMSKAAPALAKPMTGPFGGTIEMTSRKPWQSLRKYFARTEFTALFLGALTSPRVRSLSRHACAIEDDRHTAFLTCHCNDMPVEMAAMQNAITASPVDFEDHASTVKPRGASEKLASSTRHAHSRKCMKTGCCNARSYEQT